MSQNRSCTNGEPENAGAFVHYKADATGDAIIGTDIAGDVAYLNRAAERMIGWPREAAMGRPLDEVFCILDGSNRTATPNPVMSAIRDDKARTLTENCVLVRRDGLESLIEDSIEPLHDREGHVTGGVMVFRDLSARGGASPRVSRGEPSDCRLSFSRRDAGLSSQRSYTAQMNARTIERLDTESALRKALARDEFVLHYQPKMRLDTGRPCGVEALIRWNRPGHGLVGPLDFIPLLEETGLIVPVGAWVIRTACRQIARWQESGVGAVSVAINLSGRQFAAESADEQSLQFEVETARAIQANSIDPTLLEFELTEGLLMAHVEESVATLRRLKRQGIRVSTDDFGTGFSSLAYLKRFPMDAIKIDRAFIGDVAPDTSDGAITAAIIAMAHSLGLRAIAEGVETRAQLEFLRANGCDEIQGFYFSKPLPDTEISDLLQQNPRISLLG